MTKEVAEKIVRGITDKIECNTVDIDDWAEFWGFTREDYEELLYMAIKALEQEPKTGHWIANAPQYDMLNPQYICSECGNAHTRTTPYCELCGAKMVEPQESEET